jgi:nicotinate phosphoribosyltransferase
VAAAEIVGLGPPPRNDGDDRSLLVPLVHDGEVVGREPLAAPRTRHETARGELPLAAQQMSRGEPVLPTVLLGG